jgi:predicted small lipoprotein YifL
MDAVPHSSRRSWHAALAAAVLCSVAACGLKGPLYVPDQKPDMVEVKVPEGIPTPTTEKKERSNNKQSGGSSTQPAQTPPER